MHFMRRQQRVPIDRIQERLDSLRSFVRLLKTVVAIAHAILRVFTFAQLFDLHQT